MFSPSDDYYAYEDINAAVVALFREARNGQSTTPTVLDIGCGRGRLACEIERLGYRVTGVDSNPIACDAAAQRISEMIRADVVRFDHMAAALPGRQFDWVLAADILEHLADPLAALRFYRRFLRPGGRLVVSLPNVAVWDNRLRLLFGRFDYADSGVMDRTHLRFFTFRSARQLLAAADFLVVRDTFEPGIVRAFLPLIKRLFVDQKHPTAIIDSQPYRFYVRYVLPVERTFCGMAPGFFAFRIVMLAELKDFAAAPPTHQNQS